MKLNRTDVRHYRQMLVTPAPRRRVYRPPKRTVL
jgi:hypothetical protein